MINLAEKKEKLPVEAQALILFSMILNLTSYA